MFDGRFDQHFLELFAARYAEDDAAWYAEDETKMPDPDPQTPGPLLSRLVSAWPRWFARG